MRLIDTHDKYTINANDNTGYSLTFSKGTISVEDEFGHIMAEFDADDFPSIGPLEALGICQCKDCIYLWHDVNNDIFCAWKNGLKHPKEINYCPYAIRKEK